MEKIFVYGSLMKNLWNYDKVLKNRIRRVEKGSIRGTLYHLPEGYPAVIEGDTPVYGEVCTLSNRRLIKSLDLLEGYMGPGENNLYERQKMSVTLEDGTQTECWSYIYVNEKYAKKKGTLVTHGDWRKYKNY